MQNSYCDHRNFDSVTESLYCLHSGKCDQFCTSYIFQISSQRTLVRHSAPIFNDNIKHRAFNTQSCGNKREIKPFLINCTWGTHVCKMNRTYYKRRIFCMLRNTRSKLMNILSHLVHLYSISNHL
jgi:hypothetical protein